jgi:NAD(P)-dependent dehydrogenase (short-subunit alcohol dehydrogenase family)
VKALGQLVCGLNMASPTPTTRANTARLFGSSYLLDYPMTKGGIHAFTRSLASNLVRRRVNVVAPGPVWTPLNPADSPPERVKDFGSDTPMKRAAQPEELAPAFVLMAAPSCCSYITGEILPVTGG